MTYMYYMSNGTFYSFIHSEFCIPEIVDSRTICCVIVTVHCSPATAAGSESLHMSLYKLDYYNYNYYDYYYSCSSAI